MRRLSLYIITFILSIGFLTIFLFRNIITSRAATENVTVFLSPSQQYLPANQRADIDIFLQNTPASAISGATVVLKYPQDKMNYVEMPENYTSEACSTFLFKKRVRILHDPNKGIITLSRIVLASSDKLPSGISCFGTLTFTPKPGVSLPLAGKIVLVDLPNVGWEIVGPVNKYSYVLDSRKSAILNFQPLNSPTPSPTLTPIQILSPTPTSIPTATPTRVPSATITPTPTRIVAPSATPTRIPFPTLASGTVIGIKDTTVANNLITNDYYPNFACAFGKWCKWQRVSSSTNHINSDGSLSVRTTAQAGPFGSCWLHWLQGAKADGSRYRIRATFDSDFSTNTSFIQLQTYSTDNYLRTPLYTTGRTSIDEVITITDANPNYVAIKFCSWGTSTATTSKGATLKTISVEKL